VGHVGPVLVTPMVRDRREKMVCKPVGGFARTALSRYFRLSRRAGSAHHASHGGNRHEASEGRPIPWPVRVHAGSRAAAPRRRRPRRA
jgi:hypothetical protein